MTPARIVSLVPSITELLLALGCTDAIVATTTFCPPVEGATRVRGTKNPHVAAIVELAPDLVIANAEENRERDIARLRDAGLLVHVTFPRTVTQTAQMVREVGALVGAEEAAATLADAIDAQRAELLRQRPAAAIPVFCAVWRDPWMAVGADTYAADLLATAGLAVVPHGPARYPRVELEGVRALAPRLVLLPSEPFAFTDADVDAFAGWDARVELIDGQLLTWHGARTPEALRRFSAYAAAAVA